MDEIGIYTIWNWEHFFNQILLNKWTEKNLCVLEGRNQLLDICFGGATQIDPWYICPFEDNHTPASGDTYATPGFTECTDYEGSTRPGFQVGSPSGAVIDNSSNRASFTFTASKIIYGGALLGGGSTPSTKGDTSGGGILFCESQFSSPESVINGSVLKAKIEITLTAS